MKKLLFVFILAFSSIAHSKWQYYVQPVELLYEGDNSGSRAYIVFKDKFPLADCPTKDGGYIRIYGDTQKGQYFISTLLTRARARMLISYPNLGFPPILLAPNR
ncbi:hypothetical protein P0Y67_06010, partial [Photobacterium sp. SP02]|uniref:hypothetical protein n=1 Tax=Photobacterium sp. SP02 TaxID=3032280 RepID=UPI0031452807